MNSSKFFSPALRNIIDLTSRKCFGYLPIVNHRTGSKLLKQQPIGPIAVDCYADYTRAFKQAAPGFLTELEERRTLALSRLRRRGKGPPKKGQGKRSKKK